MVVQSVSPFDPSEQEIEQARARAEAASRAASMHSQPIHLRVSAGDLTGTAIEELKQMIEDFPGPAEVLIDVLTTAGHAGFAWAASTGSSTPRRSEPSSRTHSPRRPPQRPANDGAR